MRSPKLILLIIIFASCRKSDLVLIKKISDARHMVVSVNESKQNTNDFFLVKYFDRSGKLVHFKTQIRDIYENDYVYDYTVTYGYNKAILTGTTTSMFWIADDPENGGDDPAVHFEGSQIIDRKSFEIKVDPRTKYPVVVKYVNEKRPILTLQYNSHGFLDSVHAFNYDDHGETFQRDFDVHTDQWGNILTIHQNADQQSIDMFGYLGIVYKYADNFQPGRHEYYESPNIFIDPMFNILELLDWGPFQPNRQRIGATVTWTYPPDEIDLDTQIETNYVNQAYNRRGELTDYTFDGEFGRFYALGASHFGQRHRQIRWADLSH